MPILQPTEQSKHEGWHRTTFYKLYITPCIYCGFPISDLEYNWYMDLDKQLVSHLACFPAFVAFINRECNDTISGLLASVNIDKLSREVNEDL